MTTRFVRPAPLEGDPDQVRHIRDPQTGRVLPAEGETVEWSDFWERRKRDGDLEFKPLKAKPATNPTDKD